jgi:hypothetical protein
MFVSQNTSPFLAECYVATDKLGKKLLVVVVRATFAVKLDGTAMVSDVQTPFVYVDTHFGEPETTSVQCESDFVPAKPRADILLNARAVAPSEKPVEELEVALLGPGLKKHAIVTGERRWTRSLMGIQPSPPKPFLSLPLAWHLAFGGTDKSFDDPGKYRCDVRNPIGTGFHTNFRSETIEGLALPCIEHPRHRMRSWTDTPPPIGFGPVSRFAKSRVQFAGTYDQKWMDETLPFLPHDFDDRYFQAAPEDQQLDRLDEGAEFTCRNMSIEGEFVVRAPALNVSATFLSDDKTQIRAVKADTLILEPHEKRVILVGRTNVELPRKFTRLREVHVGQEQRGLSPDKPRFNSLAEAVHGEARLRPRK